MEILFECSTRYLTGERRERVRYRVEDEQLTGDFSRFYRNFSRFLSDENPFQKLINSSWT